MRLSFTPTARADLIDIRDWIAADKPRAAREVVARIRQTAALLSQFPKIGRAGRVTETRDCPVTGLPYTIVYAIEARTLIVLTIVHQSRRYP